MSLTKDNEICKHCGREIYYTTNGWIPGGAWRHYHNDKEHCSYPVQEFAEPRTANEPNET